MRIGQQVRVKINTILGAIPAVIVARFTEAEARARFINVLPGEEAFEVRYTASRLAGRFIDAPARDLTPA